MRRIALVTLLAALSILSVAPVGIAATHFTITSGGLTVAHTPIYVAMDKGIFQRHGLDVNVLRVASGFEGLAALQKGSAHVADAVVAVAAQAAQQGVEATAVVMANGDPLGTGCTDKFFAVVSRKGKGIREGHPEDLRGKTIGVAVGTVGHHYLFNLLKSKGLDPKKDVHLQHVNPADLPSALQGGSIDAMASWEPSPLLALSMIPDAILVCRGGENIDFQYLFERWMSPKFVAKEPETVKKFVAAFCEAAQYARKHPEETVELLTKYFPGMSKQIIRESLSYLNFDPRVSKVTLEAAKQGLEFAKNVGALEGSYDFATHLDVRFINEVMKEHPEYFDDLPSIPKDLLLDSR
ncbi:MAG: ABC transporter substrate-binding protein [Bacillota bacterium]